MTTVMKKFSSSHYRVCIKFQLLFYLLADVKSAAAVVIVGWPTGRRHRALSLHRINKNQP